MTTPDTATCSCGHKVAEHQLVSRFPPTLRKQKSKFRERVKLIQKREHCLRCDCKGPR